MGRPPSMRESTAGGYQGPYSPVHGEEVRLDAHGYRTARRCGGGREGEDGTGHQRADRSNGEDGGSEDVSPNAHNCLHA